MVKRKIMLTKSDRIYNIINNLMMGFVALIVLYPLVFIVSSSFSSTRAAMGGKVWLLPVEPSLDGYKAVFDYDPIWLAYANTIFYATFGTAINVFMTVIAAYALSRKDLVGRNAIMFLFVFTMMFDGGIIPTFLIIKKLGLMNTRWVMMLPKAIAVWNLIITRTFFQTTIPDELLECARLDGCSTTRFIISVVIPLSGAIVAVNALFYAVAHWNSFFDAFIYLSNPKLFPLQLILRKILILRSPDMSQRLIVHAADQAAREGLKELVKYSLIIVSSLPVLVMYPFVQRYFVKGVMIGALKG